MTANTKGLDGAGFKPMDRTAAAKHDRAFADDFVWPAGGEVPISWDLARQIGYRVPEPRFTAAGEPEDGAIDDGPGAQEQS